MHTNDAISYQQSDVEMSYTSSGVMRYVICVLPSLARERRANEVSQRSQIERLLALSAGESVLSSESRGEHPVVARKRPHGDRREVR